MKTNNEFSVHSAKGLGTVVAHASQRGSLRNVTLGSVTYYNVTLGKATGKATGRCISGNRRALLGNGVTHYVRAAMMLLILVFGLTACENPILSEDGIYEIYTLPHTEEDVLTKLTVTALDANDNTINERIFENVPVVRNQVTRYTGSFFGSGGGGQTGSGSFRMTADPDWDAVNGYTF